MAELNRTRSRAYAALAVLAAAWALFSGPALAQEREVYVLNTSTGAPYANAERTGFLDLVVAEAFRRVGLKGEVAMYEASKRALMNANDDVDQGVAMRVEGLEKTYPNMVRVPEVVIGNDFVAYSKGLDLATTGWDALKPYAVTYIHGWVIFDTNMPQGQAVTTVKEPEQMFTLLDKGRADLALYERWQGLQRARDTGVQVRVHEPPLASVSMYMYVHKNHTALADRLAQALKDMKADGTYQDIFDRTLTPLLNAGGQ